MRWHWKALLGMAMLVAGLLFALLEIGVLLIADCGPACVARGERAAVVALIVAGAAVAVAGVVLLRRGLQQRAAA